MRKIISLITLICMCMGILCVPALAENIYLDPLDTITVKDICEANFEIDLTAEKQTLGRFDGIMRYFAFDIDFGDEGVRLMEVSYSCENSYGGGKVSMYFDSIDSTPAFEFVVEGTGGYDAKKTFYHKIETPLTGKHRVYFKGSKNWTCKIWTFKFERGYSEVTEPTFVLYDGEELETDSLAEAQKLELYASVLNYAYEGLNANLVAIPYSSDFRKLAPIAIDIESNINDMETPTELTLEADVSAYGDNNVFIGVLLDDSFGLMAEPAIVNKPSPTPPVRNTDKDIDYYVDGTAVTLFGNISDNSETILLGLRNSDVELGSYSDYEFIYPVDVTNGRFEHTFVMDDNTPTGSYKAVLSGKDGLVDEVEFHYSRPLDVVDAFEEINVSALPTEDETIDTEIDNCLVRWQDTLGINDKVSYIENNSEREWLYTMIHGYLPFNGTNDLLEAIDKTIFLHKINTGDDDIVVAEEYKSVTGLISDEYYKKYYEDIDKDILKGKLKGLTTSNPTLTEVTDFLDMYREAIMLVHMSNRVSWGEIDEAITNFELLLDTEYAGSYLELDEDWRKIAATEFIYKDFASNQEVSDLLKTAYDKAIDAKEAEEDEEEYESPVRGGGGGGSFSVTTPKKGEPKPEVEPKPEIEPTKEISFNDIENYAWAKDAIIYLAKEGIISGKHEGSYCPADNITREEFIKIVVMAFGGPDSEALCNFTDVSIDSWYYSYVSTAFAKGWVNGYSDGSFGIGDNITREQMATMFYRAIEDTYGSARISNTVISFVDYSRISSWACDAVMNLARAEIMNGTGMGLFSPKNNATRAETAALVYKYLTNR